ncbi:hypothetical protein RJ639_040602 [Escallonia herrerae]|uniref:Uncharacterized protein n=1 Tax=Escallonia herrerae TaxID=1293975 RepID=A0AA88WKI7_9ASTE|nr:hypothetical protein RJ639_040602 [Escallonia herrerae]
MASLQEDMADQPLARVVTKLDHNYCLDKEMDEALEENVQFLSAPKKLRLCMKEWGMKRDREHGRSRE